MTKMVTDLFPHCKNKSVTFSTWSPPIRRYYQRKQARAHVLVAKKAVANKLARACYHMLRNQEPFDVKRAFG